MYSGHTAGGCVEDHHGLTGRAALLVSLAGLVLLTLAPGARGATFEIVPGSFQVRALDAEGNPETRAGSHPDLLGIDFALEFEGTSPRNTDFDLPAGLGGSSRAVPQCPRQAFDAGEECPAESQVGESEFRFADGQEIQLPIFQLEPAPGEIVAFGSKSGVGVPFTLELRPDDFGVTLSTENPEQAEAAISEGHIELWGVPADHQQGTGIPRRPLLTLPPYCGPAEFTFRTRSWQEDAPWLSASAAIGPLEGCADLEFDPRLRMRFDNPLADAPTGLQLEVTMPEGEDAEALANAQLRNAMIELPAGLAISPAGAGQLAPCTDAQFAPDSSGPALCPPSAQVGSVELSSPILSEPLDGAIYLGEEHPEERFRVLVAVPVPGAMLKFAAALRPDPGTGRLAATLENLPQIAIDRLSLNLNGGARALLASPLDCGPAIARGRFEPYGGGAPAASATSVHVAPRSTAWPCPGPGPFEPQFFTRSSSSRAGQLTTFTTTLQRRDGEQLPRRFSVTLPAGLSASLGAVRPCENPDAEASRCPAASRIGGAVAEVGSGSQPLTLPGDMYVTGPYAKAPFGLLMAFRAAIGQFDLGTMAVRARADFDRRTGRVIVSVDRLPEAIEGIPLRFQAMELNLDRVGLIRNPTSCGRKGVDASIESQRGVSIGLSTDLDVRGCARLRFRPRIRIALDSPAGRDQGTRMLVSARSRAGEANMRSLRISFPPLFKIQTGGLKEICSRPDAAIGACPEGSRIGSVIARTPMMGKPLRGAIHIVQPNGDGQPDLGLTLAADGVRFDLRGHTALRHGRLVTNLARLPDIALSSMTMRLGSGGNGAFALTGDLCAGGRPKPLFAAMRASSQSGARLERRLPVHTMARCETALELAARP